MEKSVNKVCVRYTLFAVVVWAIQILASYLLKTYAFEFLVENQMMLSMGLTIVSLYMIGTPLIYLATKKMPKKEIEKKKLTVSEFLKYGIMMAGLVGTGVLIGTIINFILLHFVEPTGMSIADLMLGTNIIPRAILAVVLAPLFEEFIFRKILVDHIAPYGEKAAIIISGVFFGVFHGNFQQGVMAAFIGAFFAYIYLKTGNIWYTIALHASLNFVTSVGTVTILKKYIDSAIKVGILSMHNVDSEVLLKNIFASGDGYRFFAWSFVFLAWLIALLAIWIIGLIVFIKQWNKKAFVLEVDETTVPLKTQVRKVFTSVGFYLFIVATVGMCILISFI